MAVPKNLKHKPVVLVDNYTRMDGRYAGTTSDVEGLSIGFAQWNSPTSSDLSAKVWRSKSGKISRESEELPLHRCLDLTLMILLTIANIDDIASVNSNISIPLDESGDISIDRCYKITDKDFSLSKLKEFKESLEKEQNNFLNDRLKRMADQLKKMGYLE